MASYRKRLNKWQVRIHRLGIEPIARSFESRADAERWAREIETRLDSGSYADHSEAKRTTLSDLIERYRHEVTPQKKGANVEQYRLNVLLRWPLAARSVALVSSQDVARYRDARLKSVSPNTVKNELNTLSGIFEVARTEWNLPITNPCRGVRRPKLPQGRSRRLLQGEEALLLDACRASRAWYLASFVELALETGMRLGEIAGLRWQDISVEKRTATLLDTKNGSRRVIPLSTRAISALQTLPRAITGRVFPSTALTIKSTFADLVRRKRRALLSGSESGVSEMLDRLRFHDLRHEAVSRLFERGLNAMEVSTISGHKTLQMLKRYTHLRAEDLALKLG